LGIVIRVLVAGLVSAQAQRTAAKPATNAEFRKMIDEYFTAWSTLEPDSAAKYYAKDGDIVFLERRL
jgi:hypothetical protein